MFNLLGPFQNQNMSKASPSYLLASTGVQTDLFDQKQLAKMFVALCSLIEVGVEVSDLQLLVVMNHYLKVFGKVMNEVLVRVLYSILQQLMKVGFKILYLIDTL